jgi:hypothetical protein
MISLLRRKVRQIGGELIPIRQSTGPPASLIRRARYRLGRNETLSHRQPGSEGEASKRRASRDLGERRELALEEARHLPVMEVRDVDRLVEGQATSRYERHLCHPFPRLNPGQFCEINSPAGSNLYRQAATGFACLLHNI